MCVCVTVFKLMMFLVLSLLSVLEFQPPSPILVCRVSKVIAKGLGKIRFFDHIFCRCLCVRRSYLATHPSVMRSSSSATHPSVMRRMKRFEEEAYALARAGTQGGV